ncbi:and tpr domain containing protein [Sporothrix brasiliensis 5110]|uniref:And tpr domain containing protein n=1 Tax=Sporothrix brasiliensis 5110 TaxID=1398154 RepID=A0A0C2FDB2_9PEZI|nr:and tpr domain containing protein [Sporothrix brasiliensis 5110]KIH89118.1 and tpr domain containing protein [Sporothrix brasiliensis 5110]
MIIKISAIALAVCAVSALIADDIPADTPVTSLLASAQNHLSRGETGDALAYYDAAIARDPTNYLTYFKRATTYLSLGRAPQATDDFNTALSIRPGFEAAHVQLGKIKQRVADWNGARDQLRRAKDAPDAAELLAAVDDAENAAWAAEAAEAKSDWEECVNQANMAIMVATRAASLRRIRAHCRFARGEVEEGVGDLQHVLHLKPGDVSPFLVISAINFYALGDLEKGMSHLDAEQYEAAIETLKKAKEARVDQSDYINTLINEADVLLRRSKIKDYYKVIGVARDADDRQIKAAYRRLSKLHHPDKAAKQGLTKEAAEKKMAEINEAYEVLSDPELRARFDRGDDPNSKGQQNPFQGSPFGGQQFMFQQGGGQQFKFQFGPGGGGGGFPFGK